MSQPYRNGATPASDEMWLAQVIMGLQGLIGADPDDIEPGEVDGLAAELAEMYAEHDRQHMNKKVAEALNALRDNDYSKLPIRKRWEMKKHTNQAALQLQREADNVWMAAVVAQIRMLAIAELARKQAEEAAGLMKDIELLVMESGSFSGGAANMMSHVIARYAKRSTQVIFPAGSM